MRIRQAFVGLGTSDKVVCRVLGGSDNARGRRCRLGVLTQPIRHRRDNSHTGPGGQFVVPLPAPAPPRGPLYPYMAPGHGG